MPTVTNNNVVTPPVSSVPSPSESVTAPIPVSSLPILPHLINTASSPHSITASSSCSSIPVAPELSNEGMQTEPLPSAVPFNPDGLSVVLHIPSMNLHPMQTRSKTGTIKPRACLTTISSSSSVAAPEFITTLQPLGCLPISTTFSSYENCNESWNAACRFHNQKLQQEIQRMNKESRENIYETLDLYTAFMSKLSPAGNMKSSSFLMPCCVGVASNYSCGNIDKNGAKKYVVCEKPELSIFWDMVHPAQNGWDQVYSSLKSSLHRLY
ncbi:hypothetical protein DKX38_016603 [Salix brachista]|uniref:GDSL esterase/lipase n=1 Tax=Salix brachista TaxID=2182728 RepID=A0A5N5L8Z2_9ROSI|nr:hypothetical protein DKX38_016603 [Salix brachista]